jgi:hypothetical protein
LRVVVFGIRIVIGNVIIAEAMHEEYKAIVDAGFLLQIDDPDLADGWQVHLWR